MSAEQTLDLSSLSLTEKPISELLKSDSFKKLDLKDDIQNRNAVKDDCGAYSDIFQAWSTRHGKKVAVKCIRIPLQGNLPAVTSLFREVRLWSRLKNPYVLRLLGFYLESAKIFPNLVSEWMEKGTLRDCYMKGNISGVKEICIMVAGIASGLIYLHYNELIVHSDIKSPNILVSNDGKPLLADFGLSISHTSQSLAGTNSHGKKGTSRWMAKELFTSNTACHRIETDMWAFGMVVFELLSRDFPFANIADVVVPLRIIKGELPRRPEFEDVSNRDSYDGLWSICESCWDDDPSKRPTGMNVLEKLKYLWKSMGGDSGDSEPTQLFQDEIQTGYTEGLQGQGTATPASDVITDADTSLEALQMSYKFRDISKQLASHLNGLVGVIEAIYKLCPKISRNRSAVRQLAKDCKALCIATINCVCQDNLKNSFKEWLVRHVQRLLFSVRSEMSGWAGFSYWEAIANQPSAANNIDWNMRYLDMLRDIFPNTSWAETWLKDLSDYAPLHNEDLKETIFEFVRSDGDVELAESATKAIEESNGRLHDVKRAMEYLKRGFDDNILTIHADRHKLRRSLITISKAIKELPSGLNIPICLLPIEEEGIFESVLYNISRGTYLIEEVAIKKTNVPIADANGDSTGKIEFIHKEAQNWISVSEVDPDENFILQLIGVAFHEKHCIVVTRWKKHGDLSTFAKKTSVADLKRIIRRIAHGLKMLHNQSPPIIHGHLRAANIMVNNEGNPLLGFGMNKSLLVKIVDSEKIEAHETGSLRWSAPEFFDVEVGKEIPLTTQSDIYALAMTIYELMTGDPPFKKKKSTSVPIAVMKGEKPERPSEQATVDGGLDERLWDLLTRCWAQEPSARPDINKINDELAGMWPDVKFSEEMAQTIVETSVESSLDESNEAPAEAPNETPTEAPVVAPGVTSVEASAEESESPT